jgi:hypothetical protein
MDTEHLQGSHTFREITGNDFRIHDNIADNNASHEFRV